MSKAPERSALDHRPSLFDHASHLHALTPNAPLPAGGRPYPDDPDHRGPRPRAGSFEHGKATLVAVLRAHLTGPVRCLQTLHDNLRALDVPLWAIRPEALDGLQWLAPESARETGLWLARHATDRRAVLTGLCLLAGTARPEDIPVVRTLGLLRCLGPAAVEVLETIHGSVQALVWLAERSTQVTRHRAIAAMCRTRDPVAVAWLLRHATDEDRTAGGHAQAVAEAVSLEKVLESGEVDDEVVVQAGRLLQALTLAEDYFPLRGYDGARRAVAAFAIRAAAASPALDLIAAAATLAEDLISGHAACLPWPPGVREVTLERLVRLLTSVRWAQVLAEADRSPEAMTRWRADWARRAIDALPSALEPREDRHAGHDRLAVRVVVPDPALSELVQTRLLVNGRPVVAEAFGAGGPYRPECLLGDLVVTDEPREVRLAEAYCTEGCCGALYVTIAGGDDMVVWRDWRDSSGKSVALTPFRFAADSYEEVIAHAVGDHRWEWPARTLARKVHRALRENPGVLSAWECELCDVHAAVGRQDEIEVIFWHPRRPVLIDDGSDEDEEPWLQFSWTVPVDGTNVDSQAGRVVDWLRGNDPKGCAEVVGGSREFADRLGFPWPTCPGEED